MDAGKVREQERKRKLCLAGTKTISRAKASIKKYLKQKKASYF